MKVFTKVRSIPDAERKHNDSSVLTDFFSLLQMCDIGDASRGSLSSYAYTLMVLYFLQQRNPPVIPVLQEVEYMFLFGTVVCSQNNS